MYKKRFSHSLMNHFWILRGRGGLAVRWKGFSCHLLSHIRSKWPIYDTDVISELQCIVPYPSFSLICFQNSSSLINPLFLPAASPCSSVVLQMSPPACCHFQPHIDCISLNQFYGAIDGGGFQKNAYHSFLGFCQDGFQVPMFLLEAHSKSSAEQIVHRVAQQRSVCPGLYDHVCLSLVGRMIVVQGLCACTDFEIIMKSVLYLR